MHGRPLCSLHLAAGHQEECPGASCPFWEEGGTVVEPGCVFDRVRLEFDARSDVAKWLLTIRSDLENARSATDTMRVRSALDEILPPGLHE